MKPQEEFNRGDQKAGDPQGPPRCPPRAAQHGRGTPGCWHGSSGRMEQRAADGAGGRNQRNGAAGKPHRAQRGPPPTPPARDKPPKAGSRLTGEAGSRAAGPEGSRRDAPAAPQKDPRSPPTSPAHPGPRAPRARGHGRGLRQRGTEPPRSSAPARGMRQRDPRPRRAPGARVPVSSSILCRRTFMPGRRPRRGERAEPERSGAESRAQGGAGARRHGPGERILPSAGTERRDGAGDGAGSGAGDGRIMGTREGGTKGQLWSCEGYGGAVQEREQGEAMEDTGELRMQGCVRGVPRKVAMTAEQGGGPHDGR